MSPLSVLSSRGLSLASIYLGVTVSGRPPSWPRWLRTSWPARGREGVRGYRCITAAASRSITGTSRRW